MQGAPPATPNTWQEIDARSEKNIQQLQWMTYRAKLNEPIWIVLDGDVTIKTNAGSHRVN